MMELNGLQKEQALKIHTEYISAPALVENKTPVELGDELDENRRVLIQEELLPLLDAYFNGGVALLDFKSKVDSLNKRNEYWGFKGIKGQMFFNMLSKTASSVEELEHELQAALAVPESEAAAVSRIRNFTSYVKRLGEEWVDAGNTKHGCPKLGSILFFLSYFWQLQAPEKWAVYYTASVDALKDLNIWTPSESLADSYVEFNQLLLKLAESFSAEADAGCNLYRVEHVLYFHNAEQASIGSHLSADIERTPTAPAPTTATPAAGSQLPESYVPPVVAILPQLAANVEGMEEVARNSGISVARAFEKHCSIAFEVMGYDARLLGQGSGRVPDGIARDYDNSYAIIWDAKERSDCYRMGTDDRTIRDYITTQARELKRNGRLRNIYYVVISSKFADDYDETIRSIKMDTDVNEVILMEAGALVEMVSAKLRNPIEITLGSDGLQRLLSNSGILTKEDVKNAL